MQRCCVLPLLLAAPASPSCLSFCCPPSAEVSVQTAAIVDVRMTCSHRLVGTAGLAACALCCRPKPDPAGLADPGAAVAVAAVVAAATHAAAPEAPIGSIPTGVLTCSAEPGTNLDRPKPEAQIRFQLLAITSQTALKSRICVPP